MGPAVGDADSSCSSTVSSARDASSNCAEAAFTRSANAITQRARSNPLSAPKMPNAVDLIPLGIASDDSHCLVFSVRSSTSSRDSSYGGRSPAHRRPSWKQATSVSRSPPSDARPDSVVSARQSKNRGCESETGQLAEHPPNLGTDSAPGYIPNYGRAGPEPPKIDTVGGRRG